SRARKGPVALPDPVRGEVLGGLLAVPGTLATEPLHQGDEPGKLLGHARIIRASAALESPSRFDGNRSAPAAGQCESGKWRPDPLKSGKAVTEGEEKPIRVVDRRMFTPEGELRPGFEPDETAPEAPTPAAAPPPPPPREAAAASEPGAAAAPEPPEAAGEPRTEFARIVGSLATTASSAPG